MIITKYRFWGGLLLVKIVFWYNSGTVLKEKLVWSRSTMFKYSVKSPALKNALNLFIVLMLKVVNMKQI